MSMNQEDRINSLVGITQTVLYCGAVNHGGGGINPTCVTGSIKIYFITLGIERMTVKGLDRMGISQMKPLLGSQRAAFPLTY